MPTNREIYFQLLKENNNYLSKSVIVSLLADANDFDDRMTLYKDFDKEVKNIDRIFANAERVKNGEPYQYVLGYSYFLGQKILLDENVLIPRQETEQLTVDTLVYLKDKLLDSDAVIADVCTGSGAIASVIEKEMPRASIFATDISEKALEIASKNVNRTQLLLGNLVDPLIERNVKLDVLICNPPYIENEERIDEQVWKHEPHLALLANPGTKCYEEIFSKHKQLMKEHFLMAFEIEDDMEGKLTYLINKYFDNVSYRFSKDIYNKMRFLYIIK